MKIDAALLEIPELKRIFSGREIIQKSELKEFYHLLDPNLSGNEFRRKLYALEKENVIIPLGVGVYGFCTELINSGKKSFIPSISKNALEISIEVKELFPYTSFIIWETQALHEFMMHQPGANHIVLEVEKVAVESVFNKLNENRSLHIYFKPDDEIFNRHILNYPNSVLALPVISQSPKMKINGVNYARLEKILVDIFSDKERFFIFHGQEMINIFEFAFSTYWINTKTLFRYAGRRKVDEKMRMFIKNQTQIKLQAYSEKMD